jgi:hemerythrin-like domain-containing protein
MPVVIGAKPESNFSDPIGLLTDCHRRIERFLAVLVRVAGEAGGGPLTAEQMTAIDTSLQYFRNAAPKHTADEEDTLFPLLRASGQPEAVAALEQIASLEADHDRADRGQAEVDELGRAWIARGILSSDEATRLNRVLADLTRLYRDHIAIEEGAVFPTASRVLPADDRLKMGREMAARRGL